MPRRVYIIGSAPTWKEVPFNQPDTEYWCLNDMYVVLDPRLCTRWFDMHQRAELERSCEPTAKMRPISRIDWLRQAQLPVYMLEKWDDIPNGKAYPIEEVEKAFGITAFCSSVDYMIALALYEGFDEISVYGVNMAADGEYAGEKPGVEQWLRFAQGMGKKIILPDASDLLKNYFKYGYDEVKRGDMLVKARTKIAELEQQEREFQKNYYVAFGAKATWEFILREIEG